MNKASFIRQIAWLNDNTTVVGYWYGDSFCVPDPFDCQKETLVPADEINICFGEAHVMEIVTCTLLKGKRKC